MSIRPERKTCSYVPDFFVTIQTAFISTKTITM